MLSSAADVDDFKGKKVSLKLTILLMIITAVVTWTGGEIYFHFKLMAKEMAAQQELHAMDMKYIQEKIEYERNRNDRKFKDLEEQK